ncbi:MAG: apolipoprotein N-acyltransferase [Myxococcota bacterium]|jgi:apolipoprotein N-acyltransferase
MLYIFIGTVLYVLAYPPWSYDGLAWLAAGPVFLGIRGLTQRHGVLGAMSGGLCFAYFAALGLVAPWAFDAALQYSGGSGLTASSFVILLPFLASAVPVHYAILLAIPAYLPRSRLLTDRINPLPDNDASRDEGPSTAQAAVFATAWALAEYARSATGMGNSWALLADATVGSDIGTQGFRILGTTGLSWCMAATGALAAVAWTRRAGAGRAGAIGRALVLPAALSLAGPLTAAAPLGAGIGTGTTPDRGSVLRVGIVQGGSGGTQAWSAQGQARAFLQYTSLSRSEPLADADLIVWPENALTFVLNSDPTRTGELQALARELDAALIIGAPRARVDDRGHTELHISAYFFDRDGSPPRFYDKRRLLPFIEERPDWWPLSGHGDWRNTYSAGTDLSGFRIDGWHIAPLLCFESTDGRLVGDWKHEGVDLLVNLSNDSWFGSGAGPEQHFQSGVARALGVGLPMIRASSTGISGFVDASGRIRRIESGIAAVALYEVTRT